jgi:hypothetical protein
MSGPAVPLRLKLTVTFLARLAACFGFDAQLARVLVGRQAERVLNPVVHAFDCMDDAEEELLGAELRACELGRLRHLGAELLQIGRRVERGLPAFELELPVPLAPLAALLAERALQRSAERAG